MGWELKKHPANEQQLPDYTLQPGSPGSASQDVLSPSSPISPSPLPCWALPPSSRQLLQPRAASSSSSSDFHFALALPQAPSMAVLGWRKIQSYDLLTLTNTYTRLKYKYTAQPSQAGKYFRVCWSFSAGITGKKGINTC